MMQQIGLVLNFSKMPVERHVGSSPKKASSINTLNNLLTALNTALPTTLEQLQKYETTFA